MIFKKTFNRYEFNTSETLLSYELEKPNTN